MNLRRPVYIKMQLVFIYILSSRKQIKFKVNINDFEVNSYIFLVNIYFNFLVSIVIVFQIFQYILWLYLIQKYKSIYLKNYLILSKYKS